MKFIIKVTDLEEKSERILEKLTQIFSSLSNLEETFSIETPSFQLVHKKVNSSALPINMSIESSSIDLPGFFNLTNDKNQTNYGKIVTLRVNNKF